MEDEIIKDPADLLIADHRTIEALFRKFSDSGEKSFKAKQDLAQKICDELDVHAQIEEEVFYPALQEADDEKYREIVAESFEEHKVIKTLVEEIKVLDAEKDQEQFEAKVKVLMENVMHHVEEEEKDMLPEAKETLKNRAEDIAEEMYHLKSKLVESIDSA